jgi:hypothetical protein
LKIDWLLFFGGGPIYETRMYLFLSTGVTVANFAISTVQEEFSVNVVKYFVFVRIGKEKKWSE